MKIELTKPEFIVGSEEKFLKFIKNIKKEDKVALVSHVADLDGIASSKIVNQIVKTEVIRYVDYQELNLNLVKELENLNVNKIIVTDLFIKDPNFVKEVEKFAELLIIDHHSFERDYNSDKTTFMNAKEFCAGYLCYYLFSKIKNLERYDWLIVSASVSDWCYTKNKDWMQKVYDKYNQNFEPSIQGIKKSEFWNIVLTISRAIIYFRPKVEKVYDLIGEKFEENKELEKYGNIIGDEIEKIINKFEKEKVSINDGYYFEFTSKYPVKSIIATELSERNLDKTIFSLSRNEKYLEISARRQDGKIDLNKLVQKLIEGFEGATAGGHFKATGGSILLKDAEEFKKRLKNL